MSPLSGTRSGTCVVTGPIGAGDTGGVYREREVER